MLQYNIVRINRNNGNKSLQGLRTRTRPPGQGLDPQGLDPQGLDPQGQGLEICPWGRPQSTSRSRGGGPRKCEFVIEGGIKSM